MISNAIQDRNGMLEEYLQLLHSMAFELERAMSAITQNSAPAFEESLANQEVFSTRLVELADDLARVREVNVPAPLAEGDDGLFDQIQSASVALQSLNRRYSALLKFSSRSVALMVSLFSSFQGQLQEGTGSRLKVQTWSCQV
jgi:hypothetical protein